MSLSPQEWIDTVKNTADYLYHQYIDITEQDEETAEPTVDYTFPRCLYYDSFCTLQIDSFSSQNYALTFPCSVSLDSSTEIVVAITGDYVKSNKNSSYALSEVNQYGNPQIIGSPVMQLGSFLGTPIRFNSAGYFQKYNYDQSSQYTNFTKSSYLVRFANGREHTNYYGSYINQKLFYPTVSSYTISDDTYNFTSISEYPNTQACYLPRYYTNNGGFMNVYNSMGDSINNYYENTLNYTKNTYNYTTNEGDTVTINFYPEGGFIDLSPLNGLTLDFDDIIGIFNGIVPVVNLDNDFDPDIQFPSWTDLLPPSGGGGDVNVNIELPDVIGTYPPVTVKPIVSEMNDLLPDGLPPAPAISLSPENATSAVQAGFTFFDGLGLLVPFITVAFIRLLISKFRGDS